MINVVRMDCVAMTTEIARRTVIMGLGATVAASTGSSAWPGVHPRPSAQAPLPAMAGPLTPHVWSNPWSPATWDKAGGVYPWRARNARVDGGAFRLTVSGGGAGSVQANNDQRRTAGLFEIDATLPPGLPGLIIAPLYLYGAEGHEIDFEVVGTRGLQLAVHTHTRFNAFSRLIPGDFSGRRRFAIRYAAGRETQWLLDGVPIHVLKAEELNSPFPFHPLKPYAEIWPTRNVDWAGRWRHRDTEMILHGYQVR